MGKVKQVRRKLAQFFNYRVSVTLVDGRVLVGTLMGVDKHVNLVLCNTEEYRRYKVKGKPEGKELKRMLGFIVVRGRGVLYVQPEELGKDELVETDKPKKAPAKAPAKAAAAVVPKAPVLPGLMMPPAALLAQAGIRLMIPGFPAGMPGGFPGGVPGMIGAFPGVARPPMAAGALGQPGGLPGIPNMAGMPGMMSLLQAGGVPGGLAGLGGVPGFR